MESDIEYYHTIEKTATAEFKDRGSRFMAFAYPVVTRDQFKVQLQMLKKEHPKAAHHCFAYRIGWEGLDFRMSDDGEPSGSAGRPIMGQLESRQLVDTAVIVVRYFGGTLLGVPGLINAYKSAASMALQIVPVVRKPIEQEYTLDFDYTLTNDVMRIIRQSQGRMISQDHQLFSQIRVGLPRAQVGQAMERFRELHGLTVKRVDGLQN